MYVGTEIADGIAWILGFPVLGVGQPFVRRRRFCRSNHVPTGLFEKDCVNVDAIPYFLGILLGSITGSITLEECSPDERVLLRLPYSNFELPGDTHQHPLAVHAPPLRFMRG